MGDLSKFHCFNPDCADFGKRGAGNIKIYCMSGKAKDIRLLICRTCKEKFSERKGTPLYKSKLRTEKAISVLEHISDGCGQALPAF